MQATTETGETSSDGHPTGPTARDAGSYSRKVGERLRAIRRQKRLSLQEVEAASDQEFKASVLGAYERGERAISVPRLQRLARFYNVPVDQLLPATTTAPIVDIDETRHPAAGHATRPVTIDLTRLETLDRARGRHAGPLPHDDPGAAPGLQRPDAHHPPRRPAGHRLHPRRHRRRRRPAGSTTSASVELAA